MKCSYGKISSLLTEISVRKKPKSREPSQAALLYEHIENFTKDLEVRRDLENRPCQPGSYEEALRDAIDFKWRGQVDG